MIARPGPDYRQDFYAALVDRSADACPHCFGDAPAGRFQIHRNNVFASLIGALADAYPVLKRLVGEEFFTAMAREFILTEQSRSPILALYGAEFPGFIERFEPARSVAYLADVARLEQARLKSLNAADARALDAADLTSDGSQLLTLKLRPHPALQLVSSVHPVYSIWLANQVEQAESLVHAASENILLTRPFYSVQMRLLDAPAMSFTLALINGFSLQEAFDRASTVPGTLNVEVVFSQLLEAGAFLSTENSEEHES